MTGSAEAPSSTRGRLLVIAVPLAVLAALVVSSIFDRARWRAPHAIDADGWREAAVNERGLNSRHGMADGVVSRLEQDPPTRSETYELLGPPTFTDPGGRDWWTLGMPPGWTNTDGCWLQVTYGGDDRVETAHLDHDGE